MAKRTSEMPGQIKPSEIISDHKWSVILGRGGGGGAQKKGRSVT